MSMSNMLLRQIRGIIDQRDQLKAENAALRELAREYHCFADGMCAQQDCDTCGLRDEGACERGVLTSRMCVLGVE